MAERPATSARDGPLTVDRALVPLAPCARDAPAADPLARRAPVPAPADAPVRLDVAAGRLGTRVSGFGGTRVPAEVFVVAFFVVFRMAIWDQLA
jgi:hypothetical protein